MSAVHSMDSISLGFTDDDYKADRPEPKTDVFFEWRIGDAIIKRAKSGKYLSVVLKVEALDGNGSAMFPKWINLAVPVSIPGEGIECPDYSKKMFLDSLRPLFPELGAYDRVDTDAISGRRVYMKDGQPLTGKDFDVAKMESNRKVGAMAKDFAQAWLDSGDKTSLDIFLDRKFFGILKSSKDGQYTNVSKMRSEPPADASVVYDRKDAYKSK